MRTGALRRVVQAWRRAYREGGLLHRCHTAAQQELRRFLPPDRGQFDLARMMVSWAQREHASWFDGERRTGLTPWENPDDYPPPGAYAHSED